MRPVRVVQLGIAQPHLHVGHAHAVGRVAHHRPILRLNRHEARVAHRVTQEVRRQLLSVALLLLFRVRPAKRRKRPMQLRRHRIQQHRGPRGQVLVRGVEHRGPRGLVLVRGVERRRSLLRACRRGQSQNNCGKCKGQAEAGRWGGSPFGDGKNTWHRLGKLE